MNTHIHVWGGGNFTPSYSLGCAINSINHRAPFSLRRLSDNNNSSLSPYFFIFENAARVIINSSSFIWFFHCGALIHLCASRLNIGMMMTMHPSIIHYILTEFKLPCTLLHLIRFTLLNGLPERNPIYYNCVHFEIPCKIPPRRNNTSATPICPF